MKPRPTASSDVVLEIQANLITDALDIEFKDSPPYPKSRAETAADLIVVLSRNQDGFIRMTDLKKKGWAANERVAGFLSNKTPFAQRALSQAVRTWVMEEGVRFPVAEGQRCAFNLGTRRMTGEVLGVIALEATGLVEGKGASSTDTPTRYRVNAEDVTQHLKGNGIVLVKPVREQVGFELLPGAVAS